MKRASIVVMALLAMVPAAANAQWNLARRAPGESRMQLTLGVDPAVIPSLGATRTVSIFGATSQLGLEAGVVAGDADLRDYRVRIGGEVQLLHRGALRVAGSAVYVVRGTRNELFTAINFGSDFGMTAGYYRRGWFLAGEVGFDKAIVTHLSHSDLYRETFYADAKDGWYLNNGGTWRFGAVTGVAAGRTELMLRAGIPMTQGGEALTAPVYLSLGVGVGI